MTEIILARHGETEWNVQEVFRGRIDMKYVKMWQAFPVNIDILLRQFNL